MNQRADSDKISEKLFTIKIDNEQKTYRENRIINGTKGQQKWSLR